MANYFVSYDLNGKTPTHKQVDDHIKGLGYANGRVLETVWYIGGNVTTQELYDQIGSILSQNDRLLIVNAQGAHWRNLLINDQSLNDAWEKNL